MESVTIKKDTKFYIRVKCSNCGEETPAGSWIYVDPQEEAEMSGSRGTANLAMKCKGCRRENSMQVLDQPAAGTYGLADSGKWKPLAYFDCRGMEPIAYDPRDGFVAEGEESGTKFKNIDLSDDWCEFDERQNESVGVYNLEHRFTSTK